MFSEQSVWESFKESADLMAAKINQANRLTFEEAAANWALNAAKTGAPSPAPIAPWRVQAVLTKDPAWGVEYRPIDALVSNLNPASLVPAYLDPNAKFPGSPVGTSIGKIGGVVRYQSLDALGFGSVYVRADGKAFVKTGDNPFSPYWVELVQ